MNADIRGLPFISTLVMAACAPLETRTDAAPIENATTKADHETLATYYGLKAEELTNKAEGHRHKASLYGLLPLWWAEEQCYLCPALQRAELTS